jgi:hypothetical protein
MGECPDWYRYIRAARYLKGPPPWVLADLPNTAGHPCWTIWALATEAIDVEVMESRRLQRAYDSAE